jgi:hypothetical protein
MFWVIRSGKIFDAINCDTSIQKNTRPETYEIVTWGPLWSSPNITIAGNNYKIMVSFNTGKIS